MKYQLGFLSRGLFSDSPLKRNIFSGLESDFSSLTLKSQEGWLTPETQALSGPFGAWLIGPVHGANLISITPRIIHAIVAEAHIRRLNWSGLIPILLTLETLSLGEIRGGRIL